MIDAADTAKPLPPKLECIFEDVLVAEDGLTIENREIAGLEWRDHPTRVFHPEKQLRGIKTAALLDRPLFRRPRGERKDGGSRSHVSLLVKTADEAPIDPRHHNASHQSQNGVTTAERAVSLHGQVHRGWIKCGHAPQVAAGPT